MGRKCPIPVVHEHADGRGVRERDEILSAVAIEIHSHHAPWIAGQGIRRFRAKGAVAIAEHQFHGIGSGHGAHDVCFAITIKVGRNGGCPRTGGYERHGRKSDGPLAIAARVGKIFKTRSHVSRHITRAARFRARRVATNPIHAETRNAIRCRRARASIRSLYASAGSITRESTLVVGIGSGGDDAAHAVVSAPLFGCRAGITRSATKVAAANAVDAIRGQTLRRGRARQAIVGLTGSAPRTRTAGAFVVGVGVVVDRSTRAAGSLAFFRRRTCLAGSSAGVLTADAINAKARDALRGQRAHRSIELRSLLLITRSGAITFTGIAFVVGIEGIGDWSTCAVDALPLFRRAARVAILVADVAATDAIGAVIGKTLGRRRAG